MIERVLRLRDHPVVVLGIGFVLVASFVFTLRDHWSVVTDAATSTANYVYPNVLIGLLICILVASWVVSRANRDPAKTVAPDAQSRDATQLARIQRELPRSSIRWAQDHDFGNDWPSKMAHPFHDFRDNMNEVEDRFLDPELEAKRKYLWEAVSRFSSLHGAKSCPALGASGIQTIDPLRGAPTDQWEQDRSDLNNAADAVVDAYDDLIELGRQELPI